MAQWGDNILAGLATAVMRIARNTCEKGRKGAHIWRVRTIPHFVFVRFTAKVLFMHTHTHTFRSKVRRLDYVFCVRDTTLFCFVPFWRLLSKFATRARLVRLPCNIRRHALSSRNHCCRLTMAVWTGPF